MAQKVLFPGTHMRITQDEYGSTSHKGSLARDDGGESTSFDSLVLAPFDGYFARVRTDSSHELRHTYGTFLRRHGADIYSISKILGHKDVNVTARIYVHNEMDELRRALKFLRKQTLLAV